MHLMHMPARLAGDASGDRWLQRRAPETALIARDVRHRQKAGFLVMQLKARQLRVRRKERGYLAAADMLSAQLVPVPVGFDRDLHQCPPSRSVSMSTMALRAISQCRRAESEAMIWRNAV